MENLEEADDDKEDDRGEIQVEVGREKPKRNRKTNALALHQRRRGNNVLSYGEMGKGGVSICILISILCTGWQRGSVYELEKKFPGIVGLFTAGATG